MSKEKIRLKEMSHKKLRKLCKKLGEELQQTTSDLKYVSSKYEARKLMEENWKQQFDAEVYYKNQALNKIGKLEKRISDELACYHSQLEKKEKRIVELEKQLNGPRMPIGKVTPFIGELPEDVGMGIDGQLRPYREMSDVEHQAWVAREVARAMQENYDNVHEEQVEGDCIGHTKAEQIVTPVSQEQINKKMDEAIEWAKRNGHHQPEGNPEPNKMDAVRLKSADEISAENIDKHTEMVCNDIAQDKSRFLDSNFDEINKSHRSLD